MDSPRAAVVLVGRSPTPALLSALTLRAERLVLVASDGTLRVARRVAAAVEALTDTASVRVLSVGPDPHDFQAAEDALATVHRSLGAAPWFLDYTGGTKVMSVAAALFHDRVLPPDRHPATRRWRHYLDPGRDALRTHDPAWPERPVDTGRVDLRTLARVHGAEWCDDRDPEPVRLVAQGGRQALDARYPDLAPAVRRGVIAEGRVLSHLRRHLAAAPDTEVLGPRRVADPFHADGSIADFDALVRHGHRVLCVEAKTRPGDVVGRAGWTVAKARRVFGTAAQVLFVHTGPAVPSLREQITAVNPALTARQVHVWSMADFLGRLTSFDDLRRAFFPPPMPLRPPTGRGAEPEPPPSPPASRPRPPERHPGPGERPRLVTSLGGSRLGTLTALHAHRPGRTLVLPSRQSVRDHVRESAARTLYAAERPGDPRPDAARLKETGYRDRVRFTADPVEGSDADAVAAVALEWLAAEGGAVEDGAAPPAVIADITTGTKAMSLGLALAAREVGACTTYQLVHRRSIVCLVHGEAALRGRAAVDWPLVLPGYAPLAGPLEARVGPVARTQVDTRLLDAARVELARAASGPVSVWMDASLTDPEESLTAQERPSLVLTFGDRAVGLTAPSWRRLRSRGAEPRAVSRGAWAQSVFAATTHLGVRCDVAGTVLALSRPGADVGRAGELVEWIAHADPRDRQPGEGLAFGEPLRPLLVAAAPGALPAVLSTDVSRL
ncbi:CRISPR-associated protein [Nocardiopsis sp. YSL2]|uniref:CRISPR-associated protein n=1 Tax=Nocardiopsis sp. YSL2 TaxID=2939492 RepID=UPI0026F41DF7|nr:CRISPR-associated protein [Nocardiopsis sp. YSL2]